ncbi:MAG: hypothetical protein AB1714_30375 [Acidobacteriota bacterium]
MRKTFCIWICMACLGLFVSDLAFAQTGAGTSPAPATPGASEGEKTVLPPEVVASGGYTYNPGGRRDPFVSLLIGRTKGTKERPPGLAGMLISEVDLVGIAKDSQGYVVMLAGSDNKTYFVRVGAELADGKVIDITENKVVFREEIKDPFSVKPYRDIVKSLTPGEEEVK